MKLLKLLTVVVATLSFTLAQGLAEETINTKCPVKGEPVAGKKVSEYEVKFCCDKCKEKFDKEPVSFMGKVAKAEEGKCPVSGKDVDDEVSSTVKVGTCCNSCKGKLDKDPTEYLSDEME